VYSAPTPEAIDYYMTSDMSQAGEQKWDKADMASDTAPFHPRALRVLDHQGRISNQVFSAKPFMVEFEYELDEEITGLRTGLYLSTSKGEPVFTTFDTDEREDFERYTTRSAGTHISRCKFPADLLNEGRFILGVNASAFRIMSYFTEEHALTFTVDGTGAPGSHWPEQRRGPLRPSLEWEIAESIR
jgi:lipopolysaccharide transport system ATP-binding protein